VKAGLGNVPRVGTDAVNVVGTRSAPSHAVGKVAREDILASAKEE
jgi:hypothetical protein